MDPRFEPLNMINNAGRTHLNLGRYLAIQPVTSRVRVNTNPDPKLARQRKLLKKTGA